VYTVFKRRQGGRALLKNSIHKRGYFTREKSLFSKSFFKMYCIHGREQSSSPFFVDFVFAITDETK
jgi:hypothetical protein